MANAPAKPVRKVNPATAPKPVRRPAPPVRPVTRPAPGKKGK